MPTSTPKIPILMYHSISNAPKGYPYRSLHVSPKNFSWQMSLIRLLGYRGLSLDELEPYLSGLKKGKVVGITFDDGYKNNFTHALPILKKNNFTATCYIVSQAIGKINHWDICKNIPENPLMSHNEIEKWLASGMGIGAHTRNHLSLTNCDEIQATDEIHGSKHDLENLFNHPANHFCYPYGNYNEQTITIVKKAGFKSATTTTRGRSRASMNPFKLPRIGIFHRTLPHLFILKLLTHYEDKRGNKKT